MTAMAKICIVDWQGGQGSEKGQLAAGAFRPFTLIVGIQDLPKTRFVMVQSWSNTRYAPHIAVWFGHPVLSFPVLDFLLFPWNPLFLRRM